MNHLENWQINFKEFSFNNNTFRMSFISKRLEILINKKLEDKEWQVLQIPVEKSMMDSHKIAFVSPTHGTILLTKDGE